MTNSNQTVMFNMNFRERIKRYSKVDSYGGLRFNQGNLLDQKILSQQTGKKRVITKKKI